MILLAWTPFLDPIDASGAWWLMLPPLALLIGVVYKALRLRDLRALPGQALMMAFQIIAAMVLLGAGAYLFIVHVAPLVLPVPG